MLQNAKIIDGKVYSLSSDSLVKSEPLVQPTGVDDFRTFSNIQTMLEYKNIQQSTDVDVLLTDEIIVAGDKLYDVDAGLEFTAGAVTTSEAAHFYNKNIINVTSINLPLVYNDYTSPYGCLRFEGTNSTYTYITTNKEFVIEFDNEMTFTKLTIAHHTSLNLEVLGSNDGVLFTSIGSVYDAGNDIITDKTPYKFYKFLSISGIGYYPHIYSIVFYIDGSSVDISAYSNGTNIPNIIKLPSTSFNNEPLTLEKTIKSDELLYVHYNDKVITPSIELETEIAFNQRGTQLNELYYEYELLKTIAIVQTDDATPNTITSTEASPYIAFDGDSTSTAYSVACDASGVCNIEHKMTFATPTPIYKLGMVTGLAANAPKHYIFSGSDDDTSYTTILDITQDISVDDLELTKVYDPSTYHAYKYYKIVVDQGPISGNVEVKQYKLYKEI